MISSEAELRGFGFQLERSFVFVLSTIMLIAKLSVVFAKRLVGRKRHFPSLQEPVIGITYVANYHYFLSHWLVAF